MNDMEKYKCLINNFLMFAAIILFAVITLPNLLHRFPWPDEAHAWMFAKELTFDNVLPILHQEGHFIIWFLLLMPFAKLNLYYPYPMQIVNWLAYIVAIFVMWKKAPFNNFFKIVITFSWLSLNYFSIIARCYTIGILGLFILAALYNEQIKKPYLYASVLVLTAHTSLIATLPVVPLACIFVYNLFKNKNHMSKKHILIPAFILFAGIFLWFLPFYNGWGYEVPVVDDKPEFSLIIDFFKRKNSYYMLYCYILSLFFILFFADNKIRFLSLAVVTEFLIFFSVVYPGYPHNCLFLIFYLIIFFWLTPKLHNIETKTIPFIILFSVLLLWNNSAELDYCINNPNKMKVVQYLKAINVKELYLVGWYHMDVIPYIIDKNFNTVILKETDNLQDLNEVKPGTVFISDKKINQKSKEIMVFRNDFDFVPIYVTTFDE